MQGVLTFINSFTILSFQDTVFIRSSLIIITSATEVGILLCGTLHLIA